MAAMADLGEIGDEEGCIDYEKPTGVPAEKRTCLINQTSRRDRLNVR
jgi:hypothetical protein